MNRVKKFIHILQCLCFFSLPLIIWNNHFHLYETIKTFLFTSTSLICAGLFFCAALLYNKNQLLYKGRLTIAVLLYSGYLSINYTIFPYTDEKYFFLFGCCILLFFTISTFTDIQQRNQMLQCLIFATLFSSIYGCLQFFAVEGFNRFGEYFGSKIALGVRIFATFGHPNLLGGFYVFILPILAVYLIHYLTQKRYINALYVGIILVLSMLALFFSQSRGAWVSVAVSFGLLAILIWKHLYRQKTSCILPYAFVLILFGSLAVGGFVLTKHTSLTESKSFRLRKAYYQNTWRMILDRPLTGHGIGTFTRYYPLYRNMRKNAQIGKEALYSWLEHPHNEHLEILSESGIVGYIFFLWVIVEAIRLLLKQNGLFEFGLIASLIGLLFDGLFSQNLRYTVILSLLWLLIGLSTCQDTDSNHLYTPLPFPQRIRWLKLFICFCVLIIISLGLRYSYHIARADTYVKGGKQNYSLKFYHTALAWFNRAFILDSKNPYILYDIALCHEQIGHSNTAIEYYTHLRHIHPYFLDLNFKLGLLYLIKGNSPAAKHYFREQIKIDNIHWPSYYKLACIEQDAGNIAQAIAYLEEILKIAHFESVETLKEKHVLQAKMLRRQLLKNE